MKTDIQKQVTDDIIAAIEKGVMPWRRDWVDGVGNALPTNIASKKAYRGVNVCLLWSRATAKGYSSNTWGTYKQIADAGGQVRPGQKATTVIFYKPFKIAGKDGAEDKTIPLMRSFAVFNAEQCDGLPIVTPKALPTSTESLEIGEAFIAATGARVRHNAGRAYYSPLEDYIGMPELKLFGSAGGYYATAIHELVHWTGHKTRINRQFGKRFGDDAYAFEELIAELGAAFTCAELGLPYKLESHASYLDNWLKVLKGDKAAFFKAATEASKANLFLTDLVTAKPEEQRA